MPGSQALNSQGNAFKFSLTLASGFAFSFDSKELALDNQAKKKKKPSPSTIRRNARRKEEFLKKKLNFVSPSSALDTPADETPDSTTVAASMPRSNSMAASLPLQSHQLYPLDDPASNGWEPRKGFRTWKKTAREV